MPVLAPRLIRVASLALATTLAALPPAQAELFDRGGGLIYDSDQDITWLANPVAAYGAPQDMTDGEKDGRLSWTQALHFVANYSFVDTVRQQTLAGWRLPSADPGCGRGFGCRTSEMGHLFYVDFKGTTGYSVTSPFSPGIASDKVALFQGDTGGFHWVLQNDTYWTQTDASSPTEVLAWYHATYGRQDKSTQISSNSILLVRDGDVLTAVPEPASAWLLCAGALALAAWRRGATPQRPGSRPAQP